MSKYQIEDYTVTPITSAQRAKLRSLAADMSAIIQVGKGGINDNLIQQVADALAARELIKLHCLETAPDFARETAQQLAEATRSDVVQVIGNRFVLYKRNEKNPKIVLSKSKK